MRLTILGVLAIAALLGFSAEAQTLEARQEVRVQTIEVQPDGSQTISYEEAARVAPGDMVRYLLAYDNASAEAVESAVLTMPVPDSMMYVPGSSAHPATRVTLSLDNGASFVAADEVEGLIASSADVGQITHVRWMFEEKIAAGDAGSVAYLAVLK